MPTRPFILVRRPSPNLAEGELTHLERVPVDAELAVRQWAGYVDAFRSRGWGVIEVEPIDDQPDGVFVEDVLVVLGDLAVLTSPGAISRRGEVVSMAAALERLPGLDVEQIPGPATLDGGDVLVVGRTVYVGLSSGPTPPEWPPSPRTPNPAAGTWSGCRSARCCT